MVVARQIMLKTFTHTGSIPYVQTADYSFLYDTCFVLFQLWMDLVRFLYGRWFLGGLSSYWLFFLFLSKDMLYDVWHFAMKFHDFLLAFTIKIFHDEEALELKDEDGTCVSLTLS